MGFGHRVYKNQEPRAKILREITEDVFSIVGRESLIDITLELKNCIYGRKFHKEKIIP